MKKTIIEMCPHCEHEIEMVWDTEKQGYQAYCPVCGNVIMLCSECQQQDIDGLGAPTCNWNCKTCSCRYSKPVKGKLEAFLEEEIPFRITEILGFSDVSTEMIEAVVEAVVDNSDCVFDYDAFDRFIVEELTELGYVPEEEAEL